MPENATMTSLTDKVLAQRARKSHALILRRRRFPWIALFSAIFIALSGVSATIFAENIRGIFGLKEPVTETVLATAEATETPTATATRTVRTAIVPSVTARTIEIATEVTKTPITVMVRTGIGNGNLNMRIGAGLNFVVVRVLAEGELLKFLDCKGNWAEVIDDYKNRGFVDGEYLDKNPCR